MFWISNKDHLHGSWTKLTMFMSWALHIACRTPWVQMIQKRFSTIL